MFCFSDVILYYKHNAKMKKVFCFTNTENHLKLSEPPQNYDLQDIF